MKAILYEAFGAPLRVASVADPTAEPDGVVVQVKASGICRSDWHGWMGHDPSIRLPHVPGHELAGVVCSVGQRVTKWKVGDRVTVPFVLGCGSCGECHAGNQQVCDKQLQPGFTHWGSFAEYVSLPRADGNLVALPETIDFTTAASLGCRFATSFRAVVDQGKASAGQWVAVHGCGGVGLSAIMIATSIGANVVAIDVTDEKLSLARSLGATATVNAAEVADVATAVIEITAGGAHVSLDALGHPTTCFNSVANLRKRGRHVQIGLMLAENSTPAIPMDRVIANELEVLGSHGMQAHRYGAMLAMIAGGQLAPQKLVTRTVNLSQAAEVIAGMDRSDTPGISVVTAFS